VIRLSSPRDTVLGQPSSQIHAWIQEKRLVGEIVRIEESIVLYQFLIDMARHVEAIGGVTMGRIFLTCLTPFKTLELSDHYLLCTRYA
jgi:hypothetical protein